MKRLSGLKVVYSDCTSFCNGKTWRGLIFCAFERTYALLSKVCLTKLVKNMFYSVSLMDINLVSFFR